MAAKARSAPGRLPTLRGWAAAADESIDVTVLAYAGVSTTEAELPARALAGHLGGGVRLVSKSGGEVPGVEPARFVATDPLDLGAEAVPPTVLLLPGGIGWRSIADDADVLRWVAAAARGARGVLTVSTGSLLLAATGLIDGDTAAGHWLGRDLLRGLGADDTGDRISATHGKAWITTSGTTAAIEAAKPLADLVRWDRRAQK